MSGSSNNPILLSSISVNETATAVVEPELIRLCRTRQWNSAITRVQQTPAEAFLSFNPHGTALATACRYSAPAPLIKALTEAINNYLSSLHATDAEELVPPSPLRINCGGRGTPLHEAVDNEEIDLEVIRILIESDQNRSAVPRILERNLVDPLYGSLDDVEVSYVSNHNIQIVQAQRVLETSPPAIRAQDVDGQIPLHLMIRRVFRSCPRPAQGLMTALCSPEDKKIAEVAEEYDSLLLSMLEEVIEAYPEGVNVPDHREYQETPLVLALKANLYAQYRASPFSIRADSITEESTRLWDCMLENRIYTVVKLMLSKYPLASNHVAASIGYTMLHSALFHGRACKTLRVIMEAAQSIKCGKSLHLTSEISNPRMYATLSLPRLLLQANIPDAEVPLHMAAMRCEKLSTLQLLCREGPKACDARDQHGRTPLIWLWIRYCATYYKSEPADRTLYSCASVERSVSFFEMHYVPGDHIKGEEARRNRLILLLRPWLPRLFDESATTGLESWLAALERSPWYNTDCQLNVKINRFQDDCPEEGKQIYNRDIFPRPEEAGAVLFWEKVLVFLRSCLESAQECEPSRISSKYSKFQGQTSALHAAAAFHCVPSSIIYVILSLYPGFVFQRDENGRLPLHCAAKRHIIKWKPFPRINAAIPYIAESPEEIVVESPISAILHEYPLAAKQHDFLGRLPLHYAIETSVLLIYAAVTEDLQHEYPTNMGEMDLWFTLLHPLIHVWPAAVEYQDRVSGLFPFMQAAAAPSTKAACESPNFRKKLETDTPSDRRHLNIIFNLLRLNPEIARIGITLITHPVQDSEQPGTRAFSTSFNSVAQSKKRSSPNFGLASIQKPKRMS